MDPIGEVLYVSDTTSRRVYRVRNLGQPKDPSRNLEVVAGTGEQCLPFDQSHCGEGRKATEAALNNPRGTVAEYKFLRLFFLDESWLFFFFSSPQAITQRFVVFTRGSVFHFWRRPVIPNSGLLFDFVFEYVISCVLHLPKPIRQFASFSTRLHFMQKAVLIQKNDIILVKESTIILL